jgi:Flp pilus assembly protein TadG
MAVRNDFAPQQQRDLAGDQRGAVLVVGLFAAIFIVALLYFGVGVGDAIRHHERMNDAADTANYSAAVMHARAMNLVALMNMIKAVFTAFMSAYQAMIVGASVTLAWVVVVCAFTGRFCASIPGLITIIMEASNAYSGYESTYEQIVESADTIQDGLKTELPDIAFARAGDLVDDYYAPPVEEVYAPLGMKPLPIEPGGNDTLCRLMFPFASLMILEASREIEDPEPRASFIGISAAVFPGFCAGSGVQEYDLSADADLGCDPFQIRLFARGEPMRESNERGVKLATFGAEDPNPGEIVALRDALSIESIGQAEFYFDGPQGPDEMLWHMGWRARLRRFRWPANMQNCSGGGESGGGQPLFGGNFDQAVVR